MAQARGYMGQLVADFESTFGTSPGTKKGKILTFNTMEVVGKQNLIDPGTITGTRNSVEPGKGNLSVDGSISVPLDLTAIGYWLKGVFGAPTTTGAGPDYTHVFKIGNTQPSMVLEKGFTDIAQYMRYNGCKISTFKLPFGGDGEAVVSMDIMGATEAIGSTVYDAAATAVTMTRLNNFQASIKEGGTTLAIVQSGDFTLNMGLDGNQYVLGTNGTRGDIPEGIINVTGTLKTLFTDATLLNKGINNTITSLELTYTIAANQSLTFTFPEVLFERTSPPISGPVGVVCDMSWRAFYKTDSNKSAVMVTLKNQTATY